MKKYNPHKKCNECINCVLIRFAKDFPIVIVTRWCLKVIGSINYENPCLIVIEEHCQWLVLRSLDDWDCQKRLRSLKEISKNL